jgi:hypothetical protein
MMRGYSRHVHIHIHIRSYPFESPLNFPSGRFCARAQTEPPMPRFPFHSRMRLVGRLRGTGGDNYKLRSVDGCFFTTAEMRRSIPRRQRLSRTRIRGRV